MKKMLIAASAVGAAIAGLILYSRKRIENDPARIGSGDNAIRSLNKDMAGMERNAMHSMG